MKNKSKWAISEGFRHFLKKFLIPECVCKMAPMGQIFGPFLVPNRAEMCQYVGFCLFSWQISTGITWNMIY